jgi:hypothetical protein
MNSPCCGEVEEMVWPETTAGTAAGMMDKASIK